MRITTHYYASKEQLYDAGEKAGLTGEALNFFTYAEEIQVELEVDVNGAVTFVGADGRKLKPKE